MAIQHYENKKKVQRMIERDSIYAKEIFEK